MRGAERPLSDGECPLMELLGAVVVTQVGEHVGIIVEADGDARIIRPELSLQGRKGTLEERLGRCVVT